MCRVIHPSQWHLRSQIYCHERAHRLLPLGILLPPCVLGWGLDGEPAATRTAVSAAARTARDQTHALFVRACAASAHYPCNAFMGAAPAIAGWRAQEWVVPARDGAEHDPLVSKHAIYNHRSCRQGRAPAQCGTRMCAPRP